MAALAPVQKGGAERMAQSVCRIGLKETLCAKRRHTNSGPTLTGKTLNNN
jgi:hypothetical protein